MYWNCSELLILFYRARAGLPLTSEYRNNMSCRQSAYKEALGFPVHTITLLHQHTKFWRKWGAGRNKGRCWKALQHWLSLHVKLRAFALEAISTFAYLKWQMEWLHYFACSAVKEWMIVNLLARGGGAGGFDARSLETLTGVSFFLQGHVFLKVSPSLSLLHRHSMGRKRERERERERDTETERERERGKKKEWAGRWRQPSWTGLKA